jgi:hypothetical protein
MSQHARPRWQHSQFEHPQRQRDEAVRTGAIGATAMIYAARALGRRKPLFRRCMCWEG